MKRILRLIIVMVTTSLIISSCQYKFTVEPAVTPPDPDVPVSFADEIIPIWNDDSKCTSCHNSSSSILKLTPEAAYSDIFSKGLVNTEVPEESVIYLYPHPDTDTHTQGKYTTSEAQLILLWIQQGAQDN